MLLAIRTQDNLQALPLQTNAKTSYPTVVANAALERQKAPLQIAEDQRPSKKIKSQKFTFTGGGRSGADSVVSKKPRFTRLEPTEVECRRRRYRIPTGRYVLKFDVERLGHRPNWDRKLRTNQRDYEQLWHEGRIRTQAGSDANEEEQSIGDESVAAKDPTTKEGRSAAATRGDPAAVPVAAEAGQGRQRCRTRIKDDSPARGGE
ncbi:hypothetical protein PF005_g12519 [Phytophthora fragariae]|uniref:Uncharacterized protein n=1 Tax=Phytophthora fragariae TaxID=53985 RepID=A0A6A3TXG6_9STRA|nr:hypothetical protein PF003_g4600 [Phytophthora fragariae]KAE8936356.1 hypothetical protein PF009_g13722 [Phytophthora fragariae]KAE9008257.1 hypothetical protein PF011_g10775 [Phytophthora fragariae]KAE9108134.1 hypothetical protein PF007_g12764 [Phytophthora fragariae]KAE9143826.1 hypothetical protein PF006_g11181 [Phytophthora fragariae]